MNEAHWATGPAEILRHGFSLLVNDSDTNRRLAMINIDNAVELMLQTFITLPKRISGIDISRKQRDEYCQNFPGLLDGVENHAAEKIVGIDLGVIEWFHRLRNELYHQGNGLTVERSKVEAYAELAEKLFESLFDYSPKLPSSKSTERLGRFLQAWIQIERSVVGQNALRNGNILGHARDMLAPEPDGSQLFSELIGFRKLRNMLVHGEEVQDTALSEENLAKIEAIAATLARLRANDE